MERYVVRAAKYVVYLLVLFFIIFAFMDAINGTNVPMWSIFTSTRGMMLGVVVLVFALIYPFFGFTKKTLTFDASKRREDVERVMTMNGYLPSAESTDSVMVFRAKSVAKKLMLMWEDQIVITTVDTLSVIKGARKEVVKATFRFNTFITE